MRLKLVKNVPSLSLLIAAALCSVAWADDPITQFISPFGALNLEVNGMYPTPDNPNPSTSTPPGVPPMTWDNWDGNDTSMDATCGEDYYDFRACLDGPTFSITVTIPWYRYAVCMAIWHEYLDYYVCLGGPAYYTRTDEWGAGKPNCLALPLPLTSMSAAPEYWGGSASAWECLPMIGDSTCVVPCRENGISGSCYSFQGGFCGLSIYANRGDFCIRKKLGTISRSKHYLFSCGSTCGAATSTNSLDDILQRMDPTLTLCKDEYDIRFVTMKPELYGGMQEGYFKKAGNWLLFLPGKDTPMPALPPQSSLSVAGLTTEAARFNPTNFEQMKTLLAYHALAQAMAGGLTRLSADPVYGIALPEDVTEDCFSLKFNYTGPNPEDCGSTTNLTSGVIFNASLVTCSPSGLPQLLLAWDTDPSKVGGLQLSSPNYELNGLLPTGPLPAKGNLVLTNLFVPGKLTVTLYGTNLATGQGVLKVLTLQPVNSGSVSITNGSAAALANTNNTVTVNFTFDATGAATNSLPYTIRQGDHYLQGAVTVPATSITLPYITDEAGEVVLTVNVPCGTGMPFGYQYTTNYYVPGAVTPLVDVYSFYPDPFNHRLLANDLSPSTVKYRIRNPAPEDQTAHYRGIDRESGNILYTGSFGEAYLDLTNNVRDTELQVWATSTNGLKSISAYRQARILIETPMLRLPAVLNNSYAAVITNQTQMKKAFYGQLFSLTLAHPVDGLTNLYYPDNGSIQMELDGNNLTPPGLPGYWTNILSNFSVYNNWFQQGDLSDPSVLPQGFTIANTRFDVADLQVVQTATNSLANLNVTTITTNAQLTLLQRRDGTNWQAIQTISGNSASFTNINLGFETRLAGIKDRYNPAYYTLPRIPYLGVDADPCTALLNVTVNPGVTNVSFGSATFNTNLAIGNLAPDANGFIHLPPLDLPNGDYLVAAAGYGPIVTSTNTVSGRFTYNLQLAASSGASFIVGTNPTNGQPVYILQVTGTINPRITLVSDNDTLQFDPAQPARVNRLSANEIEVDIQGITQTTEFAAPLVITTSPTCPKLVVQLGVVVRRGSGPVFDIPVSDPRTGDCLQSKNGQISIWTGP